MNDHKPVHQPHAHPQNHTGHFFNGLLVGLVLGIAIALLFTTKRGKQMVKALTAEGLDSISELKRRLENIEFMLDGDDVVGDEYYEEEVKEPAKKTGVKVEKIVEEETEEDEEPVKRGSKRHFFKGVGRKN